MRTVMVCLVVVLGVNVTWAQDAARVGWSEEFDDIARWKAALLKPHGTPMVEVTAEDGCINFRTPVGALNPGMKRADWPEWPENPATSFTNWPVEYDDVVDFDVYRYIVIRIREKAAFFYVSICGKALKIGYTTGVHAQDLRSLGLTGKQKVKFYCQTLNTHGHVKIDYIRLVSELTDEEKKGFIDDGVTLREENLTGHPYHRLEALNARAGRPARTPGEGSEWVVYRDTGTGAEVWRMTDLDTNEHNISFNCDGSAFTVSGRPGSGFHVFDWTDRTFKLIEGGLNDARPRFSTTEPDAMIIAENTWLTRTGTSRPRRITLWRQNFRTGQREAIASFEPKTWRVQEFASSPDSSKMTFGLRESPVVFLIDPEKPEAERVREITLTTRLKGVRLVNNDTEIAWNDCYTYHPLLMNLATGKVTQGNSPCAGGHSAGGPHWTIGPYSQLMKLLVKNGLHPQTEATADDTKIFANYAEPVVVDYGNVSSNGKWMVTNGVAGDVQGQHLMISTADPATVLRTCFYNTSRNDWPTNTYSRTSPDTTKLAYVSDQFGTGDVYIAVTGRGAPPTDLKAERQANGDVKLSWKAPKDTREIAGYRVYRSSWSGKGFVALNRTPVKETTYSENHADWGYYLIAAVEPSGIEGSFSNEAGVTPAVVVTRPPVTRTLYIEAEHCAYSAPLRLVLDGSAAGSRYLRYHKASADEPEAGVLKYTPPRIVGAKLWICSRSETHKEAWTWKVSNRALDGTLPISGEGMAIDRIAISDDPNFDPNKSDEVTTPPAPISDFALADSTPQSITMRWQASPTLNASRYDVHVGGDPKVLGNETIIGSTTQTSFKDWGLKPGTAYTYHVVAVDSRGQIAKPVSLTAKTEPQIIQTLSANVTKEAEKVSFAVDVKEAAPFMLWVKFQPAYVEERQLRVGVEIDGKAVGTWPLRAPYRPMGGVLVGPAKGPERVFTDKVLADGKDVFDLAPGRHTVTFTLDPKLDAEKHKLMELTASNDHSFRPEGYDPRADFKKAARRY